MAAGAEYTFNKLQSYAPPSWTKPVLSQHVPTAFVKLACRPTPIHSLNIPGVPNEYQVSVKRDDLTGSFLSGNKARTLEFLLGDALQKGCDSIVACGNIQSNLARTVAMAARQLGLQTHLVLRWFEKDMDPNAVDCSGNVLLNRLAGAKILLVPPLSYEGSIVDGKQTPGLKHKMQEYMEKLRSEGLSPYLIPYGGASSVGTWGYIEAFKELMEQNVLENFDDIVITIGSGGSTCGLTIANYLTGSKIRIHAVCANNDADFFYKFIDNQLKEFGLTDPSGKTLCSRDMVDLIEGYVGHGFGVPADEELAQLIQLSTQIGLPLDPVYTFKGVRGLIAELQKNPGRFKGKRILFIYTGGVFTLYDGVVNEMLKKTPSSNQVSVA